ncbi:metal-sensing transcriptional repressor [Paenibacillus sp. HJGM_3]|uniref:metal-sensing transcriptional repressor n=1 Tax=Paenibacillus sp. HJGM_3 TaxID=3379816 RepID=UPI00385FF16B
MNRPTIEHQHEQLESHDHIHGHQHEHKYRKQIVNRLSRIEGHVRSVKDMTSGGRDCSDILLQIAAIRKALDNAAKLLLKDHLESCVMDALEHGDRKTLDDLNKALDHYIR